MAAARAVLEKCTMMLLTASKVGTLLFYPLICLQFMFYIF